MPKPTCIQCKVTESLLWKTTDEGHLCIDCHTFKNDSKESSDKGVTVKTENEEKKEDKDDNEGKEGEATPAKATGKGTRKSTRATRYKPKTPATAPKPTATRGRGRRSLFKRIPVKTPTFTPTVVTSDSVFHNGIYIQVGDIVSMIDIEGDTYYAQIRGLMTDEYCEKSAVITWLLPTKASPPPEERFDPATYIIGPEEELPRKLDVMEFIMHAPSDYYKADDRPFPRINTEINDYKGFIWTSMEAKDRI